MSPIFFATLLGTVAIVQVCALVPAPVPVAVPVVLAPVPVTVDGPAGSATPILFEAADYKGPYDPLDPKGLAAASRRMLAVNGKFTADVAASYVPRGAFEMLAKDLSKVALNELKRFTIAHPVETAELAAIGNKVLALVTTAAGKVKAEAQNEAKLGGAKAAAAGGVLG